MESTEFSKPSNIWCKLIAALILILGVFILATAFIWIWETISSDDEFSMFSFIMIAFGVYCTRLGINTWSTLSASFIRQISIVAAFFFTCMALSFRPVSFLTPKLIGLDLSLLYVLLGVSYFSICSLLFKLTKTPKTPMSTSLESVIRLYFLVLSLDLLCICPIATDSWEKEYPYSFLFIIPVSIIIAIIFYKTCIRIALKEKPQAASDELPESIS